eukprot:UN13518
MLWLQMIHRLINDITILMCDFLFCLLIFVTVRPFF